MSIVKLADVRLFFPAFFEPSEFKGKKSFNGKFGIPKDGALHKMIEAAIKEVADMKFGKKADNMIKAFRPVPQQFPYRDGDDVNWDGAEGLMVLTATKQEKAGKPMVQSNIRYSGDEVAAYKGKFIIIGDEAGTPYGLDEDGKRVKLTDCDDELTVPYSGCYVNASVEFWAQDGDNPGIRCSLRAVQFKRDGDAFAGGSKAKADEFDDLGAGADADDLV